MNKLVLSGVFSAMLVGQTSFASGFEKSIPFGGQAAGVAGIGSSYMQGSQALFYNPAGLLSDKTGQDISLNVSPTSASFKAPAIATSTTQETSKSHMLFPFGLMYGITPTDKFGFGGGVYVSGGNYADFTSLGGNSNLEAKTDIWITEAALGAGYKVMDNLKVGLAWRAAMVNANINAASATAEEDFKDMKDTNFMGYKIGAQWKLCDQMNLGLTYRSDMNFKAKGKTSIHAANGTTVLAETDAKIGTTFPDAWTLGGDYKLGDSWKLLAEYVFTEYSKVTNVAVEYNGAGQTPLELHWKDQHNVRLATEYTGLGMPIRFGYIWTSQVTNPDNYFMTMTPSGAANTVTLGTGYSFGEHFRTDGGVEYSMVEGTPTNGTEKAQVNEYALHLSGIFAF